MSRLIEDWIEGYISYTDCSEPPHTFRLWGAISTIAAVLQRKCNVRWGHLKFFPNFYIVLVSPPGEGRKGTAMGFSKNFLVELNVKMSAESTTREALIRRLREANYRELNPEEGILGAGHCSMTVFSPELSVFLGYQNFQLMMDMTDWYDCGHGPDGEWTYDTKNMGTDKLIGIWVNLYGATTPKLLQKTLTQDAIGAGLTSRMIFVFEEKRGQLCPAPFLNDYQRQLEKDLLLDLEQILLIEGEFKINSDFVDIWVDWYLEQGKNPPFKDPNLAAYCTRRPAHAMKLCMVLSASRSDEMIIRAADLKRAIEILELTEVKMPRTFAGVGESPYARVISDIMNEIGLAGEVPYDELQGMFVADADAKVFKLAIDTLQGMKFCRRFKQPGSERVWIKHLKKEEGTKDE